MRSIASLETMLKFTSSDSVERSHKRSSLDQVSMILKRELRSSITQTPNGDGKVKQKEYHRKLIQKVVQAPTKSIEGSTITPKFMNLDREETSPLITTQVLALMSTTNELK